MTALATNMDLSEPEEKSLQEQERFALLQRQLELKRRKLELIKQDGMSFYKPHRKQAAFHEAGVHFKRRMLRAGNRFGKTEMGAAEDAAWLRGERTWYPEGHPARRGGIPQRPVKGLVCGADWDKVDELWTGDGGKLWRFLPKSLVKKTLKNQAGAIDTVLLHNGSILRFDTVKSFMSNPMGSESSNWDFIHVDEPCPQKMYTAHARGLVDTGGSAWFTLTPIREAWINDMFFPEVPDETKWVETGSIYDNPYLTPEAILEFEKLLTEDEKECRLRGLPFHLAGLIYKEFNKVRHVRNVPLTGWRDFLTPPSDWPIAFTIDPHPQTPHCVTFVAISPFNQRVYFRDIFEHCSIKELADQIHEVIDGKFLISARMDPLGFIEDPITQKTFASVLADEGIFVEKATKDPLTGILKAQSMLKADPTEIIFYPTARRTLWEIARYSWKEGENKPIDKDDHAMENFYRLELQELKYVSNKPEKAVDEIPIGAENLHVI